MEQHTEGKLHLDYDNIRFRSNIQLTSEVAMAQPDVREYEARAASTDVFGRVLGAARNYHIVVDGPVQNGCPGEAITPANCSFWGWQVAVLNWYRY